jgi:lipopolysaccharide assembly protein A
MTEAPAQPDLTSTVPPPSANGSTPSAQPPPAPQPPPAQPPPPRRRSAHTRISGLRTGLIAGVLVLIVVLIFIIQNTHAVNISFLGAHLRLSLAVALLLAAIAGALVMAVAGTARITQLRQHMRRDRHNSQVS